MKIQKILSTMIIFFIGIVVVPSAFSSNIGRNVYGVFSETYNGAKYNVAATDDDAIALYIWNSTFSGSERTDSPVPDGSKYTRITVDSTSAGWGGMGYSATNTSTYKNMSSYYNGYLKFYARSSNSAMLNYQFGIEMTAGQVWLTLSSYGFVADGNWHEISIPLNTSTNASFTSANLAQVKQLFLFRNGSATLTVGNAIDIDSIVWVKNSVGTFTPSLKRRSDNVSVTTFTWNSGSTLSANAGWLASDQYITLDLDMYVTNKTWNVKIYTENGATDKNGLISSAGKKIPIAWRASDYAIPYAVSGDTRTLSIGEVAVSTSEVKLYDSGVVSNPQDATYWCWFWMTDATEVHAETDYNYNIVWNNSGFHGASNSGAFYGLNQTTGINPKIYLGARFIDIVGGNYTAVITVEFTYE